MIYRVSLVFFSFFLMTAGISAAEEAMLLRSDSFKDGARIPVAHAMPPAGGENVSPALAWTAPPAGTRSMALSVVDPHPVAKNWVHWLVVDIPAHVGRIDHAASGKSMPAGARELRNSFGRTGYGGPQPPAGTGEHPYVFTLYALSVDRLPLEAGATLKDFLRAVEGKILATSTLTGYFSR